jgi:hypothetical protein
MSDYYLRERINGRNSQITSLEEEARFEKGAI